MLTRSHFGELTIDTRRQMPNESTKMIMMKKIIKRIKRIISSKRDNPITIENGRKRGRNVEDVDLQAVESMTELCGEGEGSCWMLLDVLLPLLFLPLELIGGPPPSGSE